MNVRPSGALRSSIVVRPATLHAGLLHVRLVDDAVVPDVDDLRAWIDAMAEDRQINAVRTSALFGRSAERFEEAGFTVADTLALLRADLASPAVREVIRRRRGRLDGGTTAMRRRQFDLASEIDRAAFGAHWGHDTGEIDDICRATPIHRARCRTVTGARAIFAGNRRDLAAFAISGASSEHGYLQRLAVDPARQRRGHGRALTVDALRWTARRRLPDCLVNTSVDNVAALALYESLGFTAMSERLRVLELDLRAVR